MKKIRNLLLPIILILGFLNVAFAQGNPLNPLNNPEFCWLDSYGRGAGTIPNSCSSGNLTAGICYQPCADGTKNVGGVCWDSCRSGYTDTGTGCQLNESISYTTGTHCTHKTWGICDAYHSNGCRDGYKEVAGVCWNQKTTYYIKGTSPQKTALPSCGGGKQKDAGLCYDACRPGTKGVGPVCWGSCSGDRPYACGAGCAKDKATCDKVIANQTISTVAAAGNIALLTVSVGTAAPATEAENQARAEYEVSKKISDWLIFKGTQKYAMMQRVFSGTATSADYVALGWTAGKTAVNQAEKAYYGKMDQMSASGLSMEQKLAFYAETFSLAAAAMVDPTGLIAAGEAYLYGQCSQVGKYK